MKKKLLTLLAMTVIGMALVTGCGGEKSEKPDVAAEPTIEERVQEMDVNLPPLTEELQQLYKEAYQIFYQCNLGTFDMDTEKVYEKDGFEYCLVTDSRFKTYADFKTYLQKYFTDSFLNGGILSPENILFTEGEDGGLYMLPAGRGTNIFYAGHTFAMDKEAEDEIGFKATAYYVNNGTPYEGDYIYEAPETPEDYSTQEYLFALWKEDAGWRFNTFYLFF